MKVILVLCVVILSHQKISSANYLRIDNLGKSSLSTEYQARFHQRHCDGVNVSEGNIAGNHHFEKSTNEEPWETFASKCASIIHGLVSALTSAVAPVPGDAMNLELDIKNHIFHHDDRKFNTCKLAGALPDCGNVPSTALVPSSIPSRGQTLPYPSNGGILPPQNNYLGTGAATLSPGIAYGGDAQQLPLSQLPQGSPVGYLPMEASPAPEPTMNTPATHEASCETTTPNFSSLPEFQNPLYSMPNDNGLSSMGDRNNLIDGSQSFPSDILPLDNWKPCPNHQTDLISPGTVLTDDCSTSPHLAPGLVTPASFPTGSPSPNAYTWQEFYNEHPELLSPNSLSNSFPSSATENPQWSSGLNWDNFPNQQPDRLPPPSFNDDSSNAIPSDSLVTPVSSVTDCPPEDICHGQQLAYLAPVEGKNGFSNIIPGDNFDASSASGNDCLPEDTYNNQQQGFVPPFEGTIDLPNVAPGDNFGAPIGAETDCLPEDTYSNQQQGYLSPGIAYGDGVLPGQSFNNPTGAPVNSPLENTFSQQPDYLPPLPPSSFNDVSSDIIPSDNLVTPTAPVTDFPFENNYQNQQPGRFPLQSFNDGITNGLPGQGPEEPEIDNWAPFPSQQPGRLPPQPFNDDSSNGLPGQNPEGPVESSPFPSDNWAPYPNQQPGRLPPQPFNDDSSNGLPGQSPGGPVESGPLGTDNWDRYPNQQPGHLPPQSFNDGISNSLPGQGPGDSAQFGPLGSDDWGRYPNQQPGWLSPQPFNDDSPNGIPGQSPGEPVESGPLGTDNWDRYPNQQPGHLPPQSFNEGISNNLSGQGPEGPEIDNWAPFPSQQPGRLPPQPFNDDSSNGIPDQSPGGPIESGPIGSDNWDPYPNQQPGRLPPQSFNDDISNSLPGQSPGEPVQSGPFGSDNWGPYPNQQPGHLPPQSFNEGISNNLSGQSSEEPEIDNWAPFPSQQPGRLPPQPFSHDSSNGLPGQSHGGPVESSPFPSDNWAPYPNQQPGRLPPQPFNDDSSNGIPGQSPGEPVQSDPFGSDNWDPYPNNQHGSPSPHSFNQEPSNALPGHSIPPSTSSEPDNSLEGTKWYASHQKQPDYSFKLNDRHDFIPSDNFETPVMSEPGMNRGKSQQSPQSEGFNDIPCESTPSDQPIPQNVVTEPTFNQECTPEYSNNIPDNSGYGPCPADSKTEYDQDYPFENKDPSGNYPAGEENVEEEQPMMPQGIFEPPALESANQLSEPCPDAGEQTGMSGFSGQEPGVYPEENDFIPESITLVPDYITPAYDDVPANYNPEMEYQGPDEYGPGQNGAPNGNLQKPIQLQPGYQNGLPQGKPNYYDVPNPNQGWSPNAIYQHRPDYGPTSTAIDPSAIYIPVDPEQSVMLSDPNHDQDSDESCSCDDCYYDEIVDHKAFCKTACRDLEEARDELKAIFDKIKKKLKCTQRNKCFGNI